MRRAHDSEIKRWGPRYDIESNTWNVTRHHDDGVREIIRSRLSGYNAKELTEKLASAAGWRAALRALAEMDPTWGMLLMSKQAYFEETAECVTAIWKAMTLAAASEGEQEFASKEAIE